MINIAFILTLIIFYVIFLLSKHVKYNKQRQQSKIANDLQIRTLETIELLSKEHTKRMEMIATLVK